MYIILNKRGERIGTYDQIKNMTLSISYDNKHRCHGYDGAEICVLEMRPIAKFPATADGIASLKEFEKNRAAKPEVLPEDIVKAFL